MTTLIGHTPFGYPIPFIKGLFTGNTFHVKSLTFIQVFVDNTVPYVHKGHNRLSVNIQNSGRMALNKGFL